jgi:hypothetical protein
MEVSQRRILSIQPLFPQPSSVGPPRLHENHAEVFVSDYSYRSATMGSTFAARRAGT